jgi:hypothetical protein
LLPLKQGSFPPIPNNDADSHPLTVSYDPHSIILIDS